MIFRSWTRFNVLVQSLYIQSVRYWNPSGTILTRLIGNRKTKEKRVMDMKESGERDAWVIEITPEELELLAEKRQLILPFNGAFIDQDPVFSIEIV